jgi:hypothetical protein
MGYVWVENCALKLNVVAWTAPAATMPSAANEVLRNVFIWVTFAEGVNKEG